MGLGYTLAQPIAKPPQPKLRARVQALGRWYAYNAAQRAPRVVALMARQRKAVCMFKKKKLQFNYSYS